MENQDHNFDAGTGAAAGLKRSRRAGWLAAGVVALIALLAGAAFVGGRLLNNQAAPGAGGPVIVAGGPGGDAQTLALEIEPAKELPQSPPDVTGIFSKREDNSIFVSAGGGDFGVMVDESGNVTTTAGEDAQQVEVVVTGDTIIYKDVPPFAAGGPPPAGGKFQQKVEPGSIDEIGSNSFVIVWGEKRGDRLIARILLYSQPVFIQAPGSP